MWQSFPTIAAKPLLRPRGDVTSRVPPHSGLLTKGSMGSEAPATPHAPMSRRAVTVPQRGRAIPSYRILFRFIRSVTLKFVRRSSRFDEPEAGDYKGERAPCEGRELFAQQQHAPRRYPSQCSGNMPFCLAKDRIQPSTPRGAKRAQKEGPPADEAPEDKDTPSLFSAHAGERQQPRTPRALCYGQKGAIQPTGPANPNMIPISGGGVHRPPAAMP